MNNNGFKFYPGKRLPVVCRDGITRTAVATGYAGHGLPAAVQVTVAGKRRTVSGLVFKDSLPAPLPPLYVFMATGRNRGLIGWTNHRPQLARIGRRLILATAYGRGAPGYLWDWPSDHAAALAAACADVADGRPNVTLTWAARKALKGKPPATCRRLSAFFLRLAAFMDREET